MAQVGQRRDAEFLNILRWNAIFQGSRDPKTQQHSNNYLPDYFLGKVGNYVIYLCYCVVTA